ncbi:MAG: hypothetical protein CM15mP51_16990 [Porticoccaceae bacterium]|nr:MAG: hypothetical protein CM15mP51_16990 [Porticoccaceae bacterium]
MISGNIGNSFWLLHAPFIFLVAVVAVDLGLNSDIDYDIEIFQYDNGDIGESTELILLATSNELTDILWTQVDGPDVEFYARNTKVISFTPQESGSYSFDVQYRIDGSQTVHSATHSL